MKRGRFITFEGGEGAGKSTQARRLADHLASQGAEVVLTREPGGTSGAEAIRSLVVEGSVDRWSPISETLLMFAARADHVERVIAPALARGAWVLCDRFTDSTRAYQGAGGGVPTAALDSLEALVVGEHRPDLVLVLDLPVDAGLQRAESRGGVETRFERRGEAFHARLRRAFLDQAGVEPERYAVIDATLDVETVAGQVIAAVQARLGVTA